MSNSKEATIQDREESLEQVLAKLGSLSELRNLAALDTIAPKGFRPVVSLYENDRKKRRTASAETWSPSTGEIRIEFEPASGADETAPTAPKDDDALFARRLREMLRALQEAESAPGRTFVALKWFRDEYLHSTGLDWAQNEEQRQSVLSQAIKDGWILTSRVPNPKAPLYPTTTIRLNRQKSAGEAAPASRFRPVRMSGAPLSSTILQDRGPR